ncbi:WD40-repeat-containing domain protein [Crassisporium funariophilum]|nr:WD40-repeat-containing domain protein [Crassisporium funariophilum]
MCENLRIRPRPKSIFKQPLLKPIKRPWDLDFNLHRLRSVHSFKESPGSINKVEQKGEWTIIASACSGGLPDFEGEPNPHSRPGSLITYCNSTWDIPKGHQVKKGNRIKHYTVNDVKFAPTSLTFVSSGADGYVRLWTLPDESENEDSDIDSSPSSHLGNTRQWSNIYIAKLNATPHDLLFKPETSILAVATKRIQLYDLSDDDHRNVVNFKISNQLTNPNVIGAIVWGTESTKDHLFASSEPCSPEVFEGIHKVFDLESQTMIYQLDAAEAGDVIALDPTGSTLALATRGPDNKHFLRLFDARRRLPTATTHISLESFPVREENFEGEVNNATYSPDGIFLALARNDNHTHVYDVRMLGRSEGPLFDYRHSGESKVASREEMYGVVKAQWVHSEMTRRAALITAGEDGCVRMWNPLIAATNRKNGSILAEVNSDVGYFSLGDPYAGEHQLVVGDCAGEVTVFNNAVI